jgi:hypothetical protein
MTSTSCHCEGAQRPKQSFNGYAQGHLKTDCFAAQKNAGLLAMTKGMSLNNEVCAALWIYS